MDQRCGPAPGGSAASGPTPACSSYTAWWTRPLKPQGLEHEEEWLKQTTCVINMPMEGQFKLTQFYFTWCKDEATTQSLFIINCKDCSCFLMCHYITDMVSSTFIRPYQSQTWARKGRVDSLFL